ncbi:type I secretion C-terminal target domain-containing protein [Burkholderia gladioli]|nr:type I secretion C-terminal target domain-containing protein [Burkholderia gladioli]
MFAFDATTATNYVQGFSTAQGEKVDATHLLDAYNPITDAITDFVQITESGNNSYLSVDIDGTGSGHSFQQIATLYSVTGLTDEAAHRRSNVQRRLPVKVASWPQCVVRFSHSTTMRPKRPHARAYDASSRKRTRLAKPRIGLDSAS